jgi:hypothetical protein
MEDKPLSPKWFIQAMALLAVVGLTSEARVLHLIDPLSDCFWSGFCKFERTLLNGDAYVPVPAGRQRGQVLSFTYALNLTY